ncbi:MAG: response regulator [Sandaracinaceae bacterium]|nr:response regulator [Sandaracinaceae bacterium]
MRLRVLVVDDNVELAENIAELLQDLDDQLDVVFSRGTRGAMDIAVRSGFDIALVDIRLAEGDDGLTLLPKLRELCPGGEVILMTGHGTLDSAITALRQGAFAYVLKPFDAQDFLELGGRALAHVRLRNERQRLAEELERSEALHRAIVEHTEALLVGVGATGNVVFASPHALRALGARREGRAPLVGQSFLEHFAQNALGPMEPALRSALGGERVHGVDAPLRRDDETSRMVRWTLTPVPLAAKDEASVAVMAVGVDITDQLDAERTAREAESLAAMGRLTAGLAHEIRNPLNGALLQLELLIRANERAADSAQKGVVRETSDVIKRELRGLASLLDEFLEMARTPVPRLEPVDVVATIRDLMSAQAPVAEAMAVACRYDGPDQAEVMAEPGKLRQALLNLLKNALEAMSRGGTLRFEVAPRLPTTETEEGAERVEVRLYDDGPGLDEEMLREAFRPFKTSKHAGTGLGLAIVARTVHAHGGSVTIENRPEGGALVRVRLVPAPTGAPPGATT